MQQSGAGHHSAAAASCRDTSTTAALAAAGVDCSQGMIFDVSSGPSMLQTAMQRPGPLRELLAFGNVQQTQQQQQQQQQRPLPPPRPPQLRPEAQQHQLRAHVDDTVMRPAAVSADMRQPCRPGASSSAPAGRTPAVCPDAVTAGPPEVSMCEAGSRAVSPGLYSAGDHSYWASAEPEMPRPAATAGPAPPGNMPARSSCVQWACCQCLAAMV